MRSDLNNAVKKAAPRPNGPLNHLEIARRAKSRRLTIATSAAVVVALVATAATAAVLHFTNSSEPFMGVVGRSTQELATPKERAAVVAIEAFDNAGLLDPTGISYDYRDTLGESSPWHVRFVRTDCSQNPHRCVSGRHSMTVVTVEQIDDQLRVTDANGWHRHEIQKLIGFKSPTAPEPAHQVYTDVTLVSGAEGTGVRATEYWTGHIPSNLVSTCTVTAYDGAGRQVWRSKPIPARPSSVEGARDGQLITGIPNTVQADSASIDCTAWTTPPTPIAFSRIGDRIRVASGTFSKHPWVMYMYDSNKGLCVDIDDHGEAADQPVDEQPRDSTCGPRWKSSFRSPIHVVSYESGKKQALVWGETKSKVASIAIRLTDGTSVTPRVVQPPPQFHFGIKVFVVVLPELSDGTITARADSGQVLEKKQHIIRCDRGRCPWDPEA